jgi:hypothetical protein
MAPSSTNKNLQELDHSKMLKLGRPAGSHYFGIRVLLFATGDQMDRNNVVAVFMSSSEWKSKGLVTVSKAS